MSSFQSLFPDLFIETYWLVGVWVNVLAYPMCDQGEQCPEGQGRKPATYVLYEVAVSL